MKKQSQAMLAYVKIKDQILQQFYQPGTRLKEDVLVNQLQVGRTAVREALTRLLGEGLLRSGERGGFYLTEYTADEIHDMKELRQVLEVGALELAAAHITPEKIAELERICDDFSHMVESEYFAGACEADMRFHLKLVQISENSKLCHFYELSQIPLFHARSVNTSQHLNDYSLTDKEHRAVVAAMKKGNFTEAKQQLREHFSRGESIMLETAKSLAAS